MALSDTERARIVGWLAQRHLSWRGLGRDALDWDDFTQEWQVAVLEAERSYRPDGGKTLLSWIAERAPWQFVDRGRRTHRLRRADAGWEPHRAALTYASSILLPSSTREQEPPAWSLPDPHGEDGFRAVEGRLTLPVLVPLLERASPIDRDLWMVKRAYLDGLPHRTLAREMGLSESRVTQLVRRGLGRLRDVALAECDDR